MLDFDDDQEVPCETCKRNDAMQLDPVGLPVCDSCLAEMLSELG